MANSVKSIFTKLRQLIRQRHYYLSKRGYYTLPRQPLANFPDGMTIARIGNTGITAIDNFCTAEEAAHFIATAGSDIQPNTVVEDESKVIEHSGRTSKGAFVQVDSKDQQFQNLVFRAASLFGLPVTYCDMVSITRYREGEYYKAHLDYDDSFFADRMYTCLIYLNDLDEDQGGATWFTQLDLLAHPKLGRAVCWVNTDPDGTRHPESHHGALPPVGADTEKWVMQLWFRGYPAARRTPTPIAQPGIVGQRLTEADVLPDGVRLSGDLDYDNAYSIPEREV
jgi:hypothetical protein